MDIAEGGGELRIKISQVWPDTAVEGLGAVALFDQRLAWSAGGEEKGTNQ